VLALGRDDVDLYDRPAVVSVLNDADAAVHTASPGDATSGDLDSAVADAAIEAFAGTGKAYVHISGAWIYGDNTAISEESPHVVGDGSNSTVAELTEAAAVAAGATGAVPGSDDEARARLGDYLAEVLLLDQGSDAAKARAELDWSPSHPGLVEEFRHGSYRQLARA